MPRYIETTKGQKVIVDDEWYEMLSLVKWKAQPSPHKIGIFYATRNIWIKSVDGKSKSIVESMSRVIMDARKGDNVDHINGDPSDNRTQNLRICTPTQNKANASIQCGRSSKYKGVAYYSPKDHTPSKRWAAYIGGGKTRKFLGYYHEEKEAAKAYNIAASDRYGIFAKLNIIEEVIGDAEIKDLRV